jgi:hypothetical protein
MPGARARWRAPPAALPLDVRTRDHGRTALVDAADSATLSYGELAHQLHDSGALLVVTTAPFVDGAGSRARGGRQRCPRP